MQVVIALFAAAKAGAIVPQAGYKVEVAHDYYPAHHHAQIPLVDHTADHYNGYGGQDSYGHQVDVHHEDYHSYPKYMFEYGVKDPHTGDHKSQWEVRDGDVVKGEYTVDEADGTTRVVSYTSDKHNGFNAVVKKIGKAHHPEIHHQSHEY